MTVRQLYSLSCRLIFEIPDDDTDLKDAFPDILNQITAEAVHYENAFRKNDGTELLRVEDLPYYTSADDESELPFHEILCRGAFPLGVKAVLLEEDGSKQAEAVIAYNKFVASMQDMTPAYYAEIVTAED